MVPEHVRVRAAEDGDDDANRLKSIDYGVPFIGFFIERILRYFVICSDISDIIPVLVKFSKFEFSSY